MPYALVNLTGANLKILFLAESWSGEPPASHHRLSIWGWQESSDLDESRHWYLRQLWVVRHLKVCCGYATPPWLLSDRAWQTAASAASANHMMQDPAHVAVAQSDWMLQSINGDNAHAIMRVLAANT